MSNPVKLPPQVNLPREWPVAQARLVRLLEQYAQAVNLHVEHDGWSTGTATASFTATNKPGTNNKTSPDAWLAVNVDGTTYYVPGFLA